MPGTPGYDEARKVYNGMIDRRPAIIARCVDAGDVIAAVNYARDHDLQLAVRGGGHHGAGLSVCDDGLVIDLSPMKGVRVDPVARTALVLGGNTWGEVDHATHAFGLVTPSGIISTTGVGGLTLGGGLGHHTRRFGLAIDNLLSADMVLADGSFVTVSEESHPDLFWAIRGGGGNFGVVTAFQFRLHPSNTCTPARCSGMSRKLATSCAGTGSSCRPSRTRSAGSSGSTSCPRRRRSPRSFGAGRPASSSGPIPGSTRAGRGILRADPGEVRPTHPRLGGPDRHIRPCKACSTASTRPATSGTGRPTSSTS